MLGSVNHLASSLMIQGTPGTAANTAPQEDTELTEVDPIKSRAPRNTATAPAADSEDKSTDIVKMLKKQIAQLQKQLEQQLQAMQSIQASNQKPEIKAAALGAAQAQIAATTAALQTATAALLQALSAQGGSSAGSIVSTTA